MIALRCIPVLMITGALIGCQFNRQAEPPHEPAEPELVERLRQAYQREDPDIRVGLVVHARPDDRLVAVADMDVANLEVGQPIIFLDRNQNTIAFGQIANIVDERLHVRYSPPDREGRRDPRVGDIAVRVPLRR